MSTLLRSLSVPGYGQLQVSEQRRMPVDDGTTANIQTVTGETVQFFYYDTSTGALTQDAGQAAGVVVVANLTNKNLLNNLGDVVGNYGDSSLAFTTGTILTTLSPFRGLLAEQTEQNGLSILKAGQLRANSVTDGFKNGEYCIDHERGVIYGKKATIGTSDTGTYKVLTPGGGAAVPENVNVAKVGGDTIAAANTARTTATKVLPAQLIDAAGRVLNTPAVDSVAGATDTGVLSLFVRDDALTTLTPVDGDYTQGRVNANGALWQTLADLIAGEDQTNNVIATVEKPLSGSTYSPDMDTSAAAEASSATKASAGNVFGFTATNSSGSARYLQFFNSTTVPADSTVPVLSYYCAAGGTISDTFVKGRQFSTGIAWAWSSTAATKTVGSTDGIADVRYK